MSRNEKVTVIIAASPSPIHPSTSLIHETINSLQLLFKDNLPKIIITHDGIPASMLSLRPSYEEYKNRIRNDFAGNQRIEIIELQKHAHLTGNLLNATKLCSTEFILVVQHDLPFIKEIDLQKTINAFKSDDAIKHMRFNREINEPYEFDCQPKNRAKYFRQLKNKNEDFFYIKTFAWSDNNHLCKLEYYNVLIKKLIGNRKLPPEHILNKVSSKTTQPILGNFIYGKIGDSAAIKHLDARSGLIISNHPKVQKNNLIRHIIGKIRPIRELIESNYYRIKFLLLIWLPYKIQEFGRAKDVA